MGAAEKRDLSTLVSHGPVLCNGNEKHKYNPRVSWRNISRGVIGVNSIMQRASDMASSRSWCSLLCCHLLSVRKRDLVTQDGLETSGLFS